MKIECRRDTSRGHAVAIQTCDQAVLDGDDHGQITAASVPMGNAEIASRANRASG
jgi:hypothetical protein